MALHFVTQEPAELLAVIKKAITEGKIVTWSCDQDGDFTHTAAQWKNKAWLRPRVRTGELVMNILGSRNQVMTKEVYAIYHGRFVEMVLAHADRYFTTATASAMLEVGDVVGGPKATVS